MGKIESHFQGDWNWEFLGGSAAQTPPFHREGPRLDPWIQELRSFKVWVPAIRAVTAGTFPMRPEGETPFAEGGCLRKASHLLPAHVTRMARCQGACHRHGAGRSSSHLLPAGETARQTAETPLYLSRQQSSCHGVCHYMRKSLLLQRSSETREMEKLGDAL